jgi:MFS family permease
LWLGVLISSIGTVMQTVGAQWLLVDAPNAATLVALVHAANTLPVMLLAPAGGVLADSFDRRWLLFIVQVYFFIVGIVLAVLTAAGQMPPALLLAFTFALGAGVALQQPSWGATIPELVPRTQLRAASRLDLVNVNLSRALGPALAGLVITYLGGVPVVFAFNALSVVFLAIALLFWRRPRRKTEGRRERFVQALRAGGRYVWHEPVVRRIVLRAILFVTPAMALWAGDVHGDVHGCECLRRAAVGPDRRPGRPAACDSSRNRRDAGRSRSRLCLARARNRAPRRPTGHLLD